MYTTSPYNTVYPTCSLAMSNTFLIVLQEYRDKLREPARTVEQLKSILQAISDVQKQAINSELVYRDIQERYYTCRLYGLVVREHI